MCNIGLTSDSVKSDAGKYKNVPHSPHRSDSEFIALRSKSLTSEPHNDAQCQVGHPLLLKLHATHNQ